MKIFYSEEHKKHFPKGELVGGAFVRPFECPERCDFILASLKQAGFQNVTTPKPLDLCVIEKVHSPDYIHFLKMLGSCGSKKDSRKMPCLQLFSQKE